MTLLPGVPAPLFSAPSPVNPRFAFGSLGGRYIILVFLPAPGVERDQMLAAIRSRLHLLHDERLLLFCVLPDAAAFAGVTQTEHGVRWFLDEDGAIRRVYSCDDENGRPQAKVVSIDPMLRIIGSSDAADVGATIERVAGFGDPDGHAQTLVVAPVLIVPRIFEPAFCEQLIAAYEATGGCPSGVMQHRAGKTVGVMNFMKRRRDATLEGPLCDQVRLRIFLRLLPVIERAFQFRATRIERYIVACYDEREGGFFLPHRDNTTPGTAHRQFAVSINLNADFDGGDLRFPEFGRRTYRPPVGGAVVFSCSLLHEATAVTRGRRYATLPFLYDEAHAEIRRQNLPSLEGTPVNETGS